MLAVGNLIGRVLWKTGGFMQTERIRQTVSGPLTLEDIEKMPSDVYKKNLRNPAFVKLVNELERQAATRRSNASNV